MVVALLPKHLLGARLDLSPLHQAWLLADKEQWRGGGQSGQRYRGGDKQDMAAEHSKFNVVGRVNIGS